MTDANKTELETNVQEIKASIAEATQAFQNAKKELNITGISVDMNDEHAFCLSVCAFGRLTMDLAQDFIDDKTGTKLLPRLSEGRGITGLFDTSVILDGGNVNVALRGTLSILLGFLIGFYGYYSVVQ